MKSVSIVNTLKGDKFDLQVYLLALKSKYAEIGNYEEQARLIQIEFGVEVNPRDLWLLNEPTIENETKENELLWKSLK